MSTIYFTTNADSGDGSLRAAIESATSGDVIMPDPDVFASDVTIALASTGPTTTTSGVTISGTADVRIILDGQNANRAGALTSSEEYDLTYKYVDFVNCYHASSGAYYCGGLNGGTLEFDSCRFIGNGNGTSSGSPGFFFLSASATASEIVFRDCLGYNNVGGSAGYGFLRKSSSSGTSTVRFARCTFVDSSGYNAEFDPSDTDVVVEDSLIYGVTSGFNPSTAGFVDYTNDDYRLSYDSTYISGATTTGTIDVYGHARKSGGALGAIEGSWLVVADDGTLDIASSLTVDYLEVGASAVVTFTSDGLYRTVSRTATVDDSAVFSASTGPAFVATADGTLDGTVDDVVVLQYGAGVTAVSGTVSDGTITLSVTKTDSSIAVYVQAYDDDASEWVNLGTDSDTLTTTLEAPFTLRVFDGATFTSCTVEESSSESTMWDVFDNYKLVASVAVETPDLTLWWS